MDLHAVRNNDVRGSDIRNEALTGSAVKESTLGTVPAAEAAHNARAADRASTAGTASVWTTKRS